MNRIKNEMNALVNRTVDRQLRLAVTGLSRSGKTAFITSLVNQLLAGPAAGNLPLLHAVQEERLLGVRRIPQRDLTLPRFAYDEGFSQLYGTPPAWPAATRGVSEIRLALRYRPRGPLLRHFKETSTLYLEIVDYPGEWLLDLPMLTQDYLTWSRQMIQLMTGQRAEWAAEWQTLCSKLDPFSLADEQQLAVIAKAWTDYLKRCKAEGLHVIQPGRFILPGELDGAPILQFFPWPLDSFSEGKLQQADKNSVFAMLRTRYDGYCDNVVRGFYRNHFLRFDRQIVLVDCLQPLNGGPEAFSDMQQALSQLMQSFHYGQRTLFRRLFSPVIDRLLFAATKADHITPDQQGNLVSLLQQMILQARNNAAFEGITLDCMALASVRATKSGQVSLNGERYSALQGYRLRDGQPVTVYPGDVPPRLPEATFWQQQRFQFEDFRPPSVPVDRPLPHIRLDAALEFLIGDKLR